MIVDFHAHLMSEEAESPEFWEGWVRLGAALSGRPAERVRSRVKELWDPSGEKLLHEMDEAGIDKTVFMSVGEAEVELVRKAVKAHPDRFLAFMNVDPRKPGAVSLLGKSVKEWGMKGLKLHPPEHQFYPNDSGVYPLYQKALELGIPVAIHTGAETPPRRSKYARPEYVDDVAVDFPDLTIIMAHAGLLWWWEAISVAAFKPNVYLDLAGWQPRLRRRPLEFYSALRTILNLVGHSRILFGSDWPVLKLNVSQADWVKAFKEPPPSIKVAGIEFTLEEMAAILGGNAARLLGL